MIKKIIAFILMLIMCFSFVGCGTPSTPGGSTGGGSTGGGTTGGGSTGGGEVAPPSGGGTEDLGFWDPNASVEDRDNGSTSHIFNGYGTVNTSSTLTAPKYDPNGTLTVSSIKNVGGKTYIDVDGKPMPYLGVEFRVDAFMNCDRYTYAEVEYLFKEAAALGVTCVQVPVEWRDFENEKDQWDWTYVDAMIFFAEKYNLKMEFLWYGTNMVGDTHGYTVPDYILRDGRTYPKLDAERTGEFWGYYGLQFYMDFDDPDLIEREAGAAKEMMNHIYEYNNTHGDKKTVVGIQVLNEACVFFNWRITGKKVIDPDTGAIMNKETAITKVCNSMDAIGKAIKSAQYKVYTRTNIADTYTNNGSFYNNGQEGVQSAVKAAPSYVQRMYNLEGIDIIGDDTYKDQFHNVKGVLQMYKKLSGNFTHIAENNAAYPESAQMILTAMALGGGYSLYDLVTPPYFIENGTASVDQGILQYDPNSKTNYIKRDHYAQVQSIFKGLQKACTAQNDYAVVKCMDGNFGAFIKTDKTQTIKLVACTVTVTRQTGGSRLAGFAIAHGANVYFYFNEPVTVSYTDASGTYNNVSVAKDSLVQKSLDGLSQTNNVWEVIV